MRTVCAFIDDFFGRGGRSLGPDLSPPHRHFAIDFISTCGAHFDRPAPVRGTRAFLKDFLFVGVVVGLAATSSNQDYGSLLSRITHPGAPQCLFAHFLFLNSPCRLHDDRLTGTAGVKGFTEISKSPL